MAEINDTQTAEAIQAVLIPIDSASLVHLAVKKLPEGKGFGVRPGQSIWCYLKCDFWHFELFYIKTSDIFESWGKTG